ncbi:MAG: phosphomannomutase [Actinomycetota bacterium]|nr:phosphomannomutase [Actinomycetota bacterium]
MLPPMSATATPNEQLLTTARAWLAEDPDPVTSAELQALMAEAIAGDPDSVDELADSFSGTLQFGTAGLRGRLGPGSNRMNRVVVARAAAGLAEYLKQRGGKSVVIGYDARRNSDVFAHDSARIMAGAGLKAYVYPRALPTPVLAFAIRPLRADAGIMVTASHNPPDDNGYKVYLGDGSQIVPPSDAEISECIADVGAYADIPRSDAYETLGPDMLDKYVKRAVSLLPSGPREIVSVYTAMHGVGGSVFMRAAEAAGFPEPHKVVEQFYPDARFPTVPFPNPEEPGAMDLSLATARAVGADIVVANDPDADRSSAAIPFGGDWRKLTGDEVGALLGWWIGQRAKREGKTVDGVFAQSIVSGSLLAKIAEDAGAEYTTTLTGFKWISRVPELVFGYEEALGYCVDPKGVRDKDGITASLLMLELAAHLKAEGRTIQDVLDDLARQFGLHVTGQLAIRVDDLSIISDAMARLRAQPPTEIGGREVLKVEDLNMPTGDLPPTDGLRFTMDGARVVVRPSGTEPKLKCYLQVVVPGTGDVIAAREAGAAELQAVKDSVAAALGI